MNKEQAREAAIEWCGEEVKKYHRCGIGNCKSKISMCDYYFGCFIFDINGVLLEDRRFEFKELKAPPRGSLMRVWGSGHHRDENIIRTSSGSLSKEGHVFDVVKRPWDYWEELVVVDNGNNNTGEEE